MKFSTTPTLEDHSNDIANASKKIAEDIGTKNRFAGYHTAIIRDAVVFQRGGSSAADPAPMKKSCAKRVRSPSKSWKSRPRRWVLTKKIAEDIGTKNRFAGYHTAIIRDAVVFQRGGS
jgi:ribosomal protein S17E